MRAVIATLLLDPALAASRLVNLLNARSHRGMRARGAAAIAALVRIGESPFRTPGKKDKPLR
jgi:hypothetical protein